MLMMLALACKDPVDAEDVTTENGMDLNTLTAYLFREWDNEDPAIMVTGIDDLETIAADFPADSSNYAERSFEGVQALSADDVSDVELSHGYNPSDAGGVGILYQSAHPLAEHVELFSMVDQTVIEPASPVYERTIVEGGDCFPAGDCQTMLSENDVQRKNILIDTEHQITKTWRWVELEDGRKAVAGRTWQPALADSDKEDKIFQNYSVELWIPTDTGTLRFLNTWSENSFQFADTLILSSINDALNAAEDYLAE